MRPPTAHVSPARLAAFRILLLVATEQRHADDLLHGLTLKKLELRDRALATTLVMGTLRWQLMLDSAIAPLLRTGTVLAPEVAIALRMGLLQLWFLDRIPAHAALSESVDLVKLHGFAGMAGLVNALLRKLSRQPAPAEDKAAVLAHPAWMVERWRIFYGEKAAQAICEADQQVRPATVHLGGPAATEGHTAGAFLTAAATVSGSPEKDQPELRIQDEGSQLVAELAASANPAALRVLDACAAPGGKTAILAGVLPNAQIIACDISATRLKTMRQLLPSSLAGRITTVQADASHFPGAPPFDAPFDLVLCDVPCSGTGTLARNPEIRLRLQLPDISQYAQKQLQILQSCWRRLRPGGVLVYSTCSLEREENAFVVERFLASATHAELRPAADVLRQMQSQGRLTESGAELLQASALQGNCLRTLPGVHPCDGFFVAVLRKTGQLNAQS
jgi:16S rRNA (cytosine967-C5)-methyltransferase